MIGDDLARFGGESFYAPIARKIVVELRSCNEAKLREYLCRYVAFSSRIAFAASVRKVIE